jgi:UDP-N-acetylglucosamine 2-epimerase (non-hydrolysing)
MMTPAAGQGTRAKKRIAVIFGTRPEAIKLCPVVPALAACERVEVHVCVTGQHRQMLDQILATFEVTPDADLNLMAPNQSLAALSARALRALDHYLAEATPDLVLVQGDTTTAFCATLAAFYRRIPVAHVEAGLRTGNLDAPYPEEANRVLISHLAAFHFAPTETARANLVREGIPGERIAVTGNTVIDALQAAAKKSAELTLAVPGLPPSLLETEAGPLVLVTGHRRESFGAGFEAICQAIKALAHRFPGTSFVYPVHLNPNVCQPVHRILHGLPNVHLIEPLEYLPFVRLMTRAVLLLTDSGGIQEEAPALRKPVLVMRDTTERPEVIEAGVAKLVGTDARRIADEVTTILTDPYAYAAMARGANPYGDGTAARRIAALCERLLESRPGVR